MMAVAFTVGQAAAAFVNPELSNGAWPMVVPMALAGVALVLIAFTWLPRLPTSHQRKETP
jgi:DHA1 family bicyclomycin/chloramphenicol resistance-like MFS transporter